MFRVGKTKVQTRRQKKPSGRPAPVAGHLLPVPAPGVAHALVALLVGNGSGVVQVSVDAVIEEAGLVSWERYHRYAYAPPQVLIAADPGA
jgi:hypothetical protein